MTNLPNLPNLTDLNQPIYPFNRTNRPAQPTQHSITGLPTCLSYPAFFHRPTDLPILPGIPSWAYRPAYPTWHSFTGLPTCLSYPALHLRPTDLTMEVLADAGVVEPRGLHCAAMTCTRTAFEVRVRTAL